MSGFELVAPFAPAGHQPQAIADLVRAARRGDRHQVLLGVTGSGKTMTVAHVIRELAVPTLVLSHNKTLAAQLYGELKSFFPGNAVEYFISYYDYYQPEAYVPSTDTYIEKDSSINEDIDRLRLRATSSLMERQDVVVVASVSCIFGLGSAEEYAKKVISVTKGTTGMSIVPSWNGAVWSMAYWATARIWSPTLRPARFIRRWLVWRGTRAPLMRS